MRRILLTLTTIAWTVSAAWAAERPITVTGDREYAPYTYEEDGVARGLAIELLRAVEEETDLRFDIKLDEWADAQRKVAEGSVDAVGIIALSEERAKLFDFTDDPLSLAFSLYTRAGDVFIQGAADLPGRKVGVTRGGFPRSYLREFVPAAVPVLIKNYAEGFDKLLAGQVDAVFADTWVGAYTIQNLHLQGLRRAPEPLAIRRAAFAVRKGNKAMLDRLNDGFSRARAAGKIDRILADWSSQEVIFVTRSNLKNYVVAGVATAAGVLLVGSLILIGALRRQVKRKTAELREANEMLEQRVADRTRDQQALEARMRQTEKMQAIGRLAGGIAHDFNNQLTGILGFATILAKQQTSAQSKRYVELIIQAAQNSGALTRQLLTFARKGHQKMEPIDLHALLNDLVAILERSLDKKIRVEMRLAASHAEIVGDAALLQSCFLNLALNARDAMPDGGTLTFTTAVEARGGKEHLAVHIADSGTGMSEDVRRRIFEPFFTTKEQGRGTGMGLALVHGTIHAHGGTIDVSSQEGKGTDFRLSLPLLPSQPHVDAAAAPAKEGPLPGEPRILVCDDEEVARAATAGILTDFGALVSSCDSGAAAVTAIERQPTAFDLIVMDVNMPGLSGVEAVAALRAFAPNVPVLLVSGYTFDAEPIGAPFLVKPFAADELVRVVRGLLG